MPARIVVISGPDSGRRFEIETQVVSIGGHPGSELCLSGEPESVATVRFRNNAYSIFNRCGDSLDLAVETVLPDGMLRWKPGMTLQLISGVKLTLEIEGDPSPVRRQTAPQPSLDAGVEDELPSQESQDEAEPEAKSQNATWLLVGVLVVIIFINLSLDDSNSEDPRNDRQEFHSIVNVLLSTEMRPQETSSESATGEEARQDLLELVSKSTPEEQTVFASVRERIQTARVAELRSDPKGALRHYQRARDLLQLLGADQHLSTDSGEAGNQESDSIYTVVYQFVVMEIESISG